MNVSVTAWVHGCTPGICMHSKSGTLHRPKVRLTSGIPSMIQTYGVCVCFQLFFHWAVCIRDCCLLAETLLE